MYLVTFSKGATLRYLSASTGIDFLPEFSTFMSCHGWRKTGKVEEEKTVKIMIYENR